MRIAGAVLFMGAAASFVLACTVPNGQNAAIVGADAGVIQSVDAQPVRIKPEAAKPDSMVGEPAEALLHRS